MKAIEGMCFAFDVPANVQLLAIIYPFPRMGLKEVHRPVYGKTTTVTANPHPGYVPCIRTLFFYPLLPAR